MTRRLLPFALLLALIGYFAPWVNHPVTGLVITGLDLGEYVKFLPEVRNGEIPIWRVGFYAPLVAVSATSLLIAYRRDLCPGWLRLPLLALATVAALNLVPPAWTPLRLLEPEFRLQAVCLVLLLLGVGFAPFLALISRHLAAAIVALLSIAAIVFPLHGFFQVLPAISALYARSLTPAWGLWLMVAALAVIPLPVARLSRRQPSDDRHR